MENEFKEDMRKNSEKTVNSNSTYSSDYSNKSLSKNATQPLISSMFSFS